MNENNEQNGGLFSEDYEAPKRENPYLKKNRDKAKAEKTKAKKEKPAEAASAYVATEDKPMTAEEAPVSRPVYTPAREEGGYVRKRTFSDWMFEHVKLIATIATILVVLSLVLITDVVGIVENLITQSQQADSEAISLTYIYGLTQKSEPIQWRDFEKFRHKVSKADDSVTWKLEVGDTQYELWVSGADMSKPPSDIWLIDWNTGDRMILGEDDLEQFLAEHNQK
jgi:hypothetical protein